MHDDIEALEARWTAAQQGAEAPGRSWPRVRWRRPSESCLQKPSVVSAQAAGSDFPPGLRSTKIDVFGKFL